MDSEFTEVGQGRFKFSKKNIFSLVGLVVLLLAIPVGIFLEQHSQTLFSHAAASEPLTPTTAFVLNAPPQVAPGQTFNVDIKVRSDIDPTNLFAAKLQFDPNLLEVQSIQTTSAGGPTGKLCKTDADCSTDQQCGYIPDNPLCNPSTGCNQPQGYCVERTAVVVDPVSPTPAPITCTCDVPGGKAGSAGGSSPYNHFTCTDGESRYCATNEMCTSSSQMSSSGSGPWPCAPISSSVPAPVLSPTTPPAVTIPLDSINCGTLAFRGESIISDTGGGASCLYKAYKSCANANLNVTEMGVDAGRDWSFYIEKNANGACSIVGTAGNYSANFGGNQNTQKFTCSDMTYANNNLAISCGDQGTINIPMSSSAPGVNDYFIQNWVTNTFDNSAGTISLVGGVPAPGFQTNLPNSSTMATITFKAKAAGTANLTFVEPDTAIYRNSDNIDILAGRDTAAITIGNSNNSSDVITATPSCSSGDEVVSGNHMDISYSGSITTTEDNEGYYMALLDNSTGQEVKFSLGGGDKPSGTVLPIDGVIHGSVVSLDSGGTGVLVPLQGDGRTYTLKVYAAPAAFLGQLFGRPTGPLLAQTTLSKSCDFASATPSPSGGPTGQNYAATCKANPKLSPPKDSSDPFVDLPSYSLFFTHWDSVVNPKNVDPNFPMNLDFNCDGAVNSIDFLTWRSGGKGGPIPQPL